MKITALRNFIANDVKGFPGYLLTQEECDAIANVLEGMKKEGLVHCEAGQPADEKPENNRMIDDGPEGDDDLPDNPSDDLPSEAIVEAPKPKTKKKKK